jgi:hypothetical protein
MSNFLEKRISVKTLFIIIAFFLIFGSVILYFTFGGITEGFQAGLVGLGAAIDYKMGDGVKKSWENKDTILNTVNPVMNVESVDTVNDSANIYSDLEKNEGGPVPLPEDELLMFDKNKFSPECCPSPYSNSDGCVCASPEQMKYLNERGGNRTLTSEY